MARGVPGFGTGLVLDDPPAPDPSKPPLSTKVLTGPIVHRRGWVGGVEESSASSWGDSSPRVLRENVPGLSGASKERPRDLLGKSSGWGQHRPLGRSQPGGGREGGACWG